MEGPLIQALREALAKRTPQALQSDDATPAAVLVLLFSKNGGCHLLLNRRSALVSHHKGEIAFPGGAWEPEDTDMLACALREAEEEMGVRPADVTVLGGLDPVLTRTRFLVSPFVGTIPYPYPFAVDRREVAEMVEVSLDTLLDPSALRFEARLAADGALDRSCTYAVGEHLVFGATAQILTQLLALVREAMATNKAAEVVH